ncbi:choice-of-anchor D domain-containing protein [Kribbella sp. NPDC050241]|uniref:choice-of-anchor D domain-containing protein n=1 Tax=Kribbella sp. NPDC050241 TaxID=3364115 RepID=UPI0037BE0209
MAVAVALVAMTAMLAGATSAVAKPGVPVLAFAPSPYDFGRVTPGESASRGFTLTNTGRKATGKLKVTLSGAATFTVTSDRCSGTRLRPGKSCVVMVRFAPTSVATATATVAAASKGRVSATVALSGTGTGLGGAQPGQLYWSGDDIWAADVDGSNPHNILSAFEPTLGVAVDSSHVYWINTNTGAVRRANPDGSNAQDLVPGSNAAPGTGGLAVDANHVYWTSYAAGSAPGTIWRANVGDGSNPQAIATAQATPFGIAVDGSHIYWTNSGDGTIWRANLDGTDAQSIVQGEGQQSLFAVTVDANHLYWTNRSQNTVKRANLDGTNPQTLLSGQSLPQAIAVDALYVYWSNLGDGTGAIRRANLADGTNPQVFIANTASPQLMAFTPPPAPALGFTPSSHDFGEVATKQAASQSFTLANSVGHATTGPLTVTVTGSAAFTTGSDTCTGTSLVPGASCTVTVSFAPTSLGIVTANLTAASQTPAASTTAALTGTGVGHIYWVNQGQTIEDGSVNVASSNGSNAQVIDGSGLPSFPVGVAVANSALYVASLGDLATDPDVGPAIIDYNSPVQEDCYFADSEGPDKLAINPNNPNDLYYRSPVTASDRPTIWRGTWPDCTSFHPIVTTQGLPQLGGLAVDANHVYWSNYRQLEGDGTIMRANLDGTGPVQLAQGLDAPQGLAVDANYLYWTNDGTTIVRASLHDVPFTPETIVTNQTGIPVALAVDATHLYWTTYNGTIWRANLDGTNPQQIIAGQNKPVAITASP